MNRKQRTQAGKVRFGPAIVASVLVLLLGGSAAGYVVQKNHIQALGRQLKETEVKLDRLRLDNRQLVQQLNLERSPVYLKDRVVELHLDLHVPELWQILRIPETPQERTPPPTGQRYVGSTSRYMTLN